MPNQYTKKNQNKKPAPVMGGVSTPGAALLRRDTFGEDKAISEMVQIPNYQLEDLKRDRIALGESRGIIKVLKDEIRTYRLTAMIVAGVHVQDAERLSREFGDRGSVTGY